ncbi:DNA polymerase II [Persicimonas caeni]|uniref:DNA polymerase II n=1 Tax=Persicimonas caeni TaxID=2292766 RepID=UPI0024832C42|nr:DNA polymerase II [Persicimonas caeni]
MLRLTSRHERPRQEGRDHQTNDLLFHVGPHHHISIITVESGDHRPRSPKRQPRYLGCRTRPPSAPTQLPWLPFWLARTPAKARGLPFWLARTPAKARGLPFWLARTPAKARGLPFWLARTPTRATLVGVLARKNTHPDALVAVLARKIANPTVWVGVLARKYANTAVLAVNFSTFFTSTYPFRYYRRVKGTLLTKRWYESRGRLYLEYWVRLDEGAGRIVVDREPAVFFVARDVPTQAGTRRAVDLESMDHKPVDAVYFTSQRALMDERDRLLREQHYLAMEADVWPSDRFLMERFITGTMHIDGEPRRRNGVLEWRNPKLTPADAPHELRLLSFDIETEGLHGRVLSIAGVCGDESRVFVDRPDVDSPHFISCDGEAAVIRAFQSWLQEVDPDVLTGWNVIGFDLRVLLERAKKNRMRLRLGRGRGRTSVRKTNRRGGMIADVEGRVVLDGRPTLQASGYYAERYSLEYTSQHLLGEGKTLRKVEDKAAEILRLYHDEPDQLAIYNLKDCVLVQRIFAKQDLLGFVLERQQLTGLEMDRLGGSVAAFDHLYLPRLHRRGYVAPTIDNDADGADSPGGYVMDSTPGLFRNVLVLDFKSLYPSIIRTFKVDPYGLIEGLRQIDSNMVSDTVQDGVNMVSDTMIAGFREAYFHPDDHILPGLIEELWAARDEAKKRGDTARSTAIKILMNSFYGVLGTTGCRFFDPRLASSITMRGHQIIQETRDLIEELGYEVVYGDTDSVFVRVGDEHAPDEARAIGHQLAARVNRHWRDWCSREHGVESHLEMEFETHYVRFFLPTKRNSTEGSKKRYAGWVLRAGGEAEVVVKGMEAARTDWTRLARDFQLELFRRVFADELDGIRAWVKEVVLSVREGRRDDELVYTKKLRRHPDEYTNTPPHVAAAKILGGNPRRISYVITHAGPQPHDMVDSPIDYEHYVDKQLQPAAEAILAEVGVDFERLADRQVWLF